MEEVSKHNSNKIDSEYPFTSLTIIYKILVYITAHSERNFGFRTNLFFPFLVRMHENAIRGVVACPLAEKIPSYSSG